MVAKIKIPLGIRNADVRPVCSVGFKIVHWAVMNYIWWEGLHCGQIVINFLVRLNTVYMTLYYRNLANRWQHNIKFYFIELHVCV